MPKGFNQKLIYRIIDANLNRAKEGLRVCEDITRFILESPSLTANLKQIRHKLDKLILSFAPQRYKLLLTREAKNDVGRLIFGQELKRSGISDILFANIQRVKESIRVLEEFSKLSNAKRAADFKAARYSVYELEKKIAKKAQALRNYR